MPKSFSIKTIFNRVKPDAPKYSYICLKCKNKMVSTVAQERCTLCNSELVSLWLVNEETLEPIFPDHACPSGSTPPTGSKFDTGKPQWSLMPWRELGDVVRVLTMGAQKYSRDNWKHVENAKTRYTDALMRHMTAWAGGERLDSESEITHLAHVVCCALFLMWFDNEDPETIRRESVDEWAKRCRVMASTPTVCLPPVLIDENGNCKKRFDCPSRKPHSVYGPDVCEFLGNTGGCCHSAVSKHPGGDQ